MTMSQDFKKLIVKIIFKINKNAEKQYYKEKHVQALIRKSKMTGWEVYNIRKWSMTGIFAPNIWGMGWVEYLLR